MTYRKPLYSSCIVVLFFLFVRVCPTRAYNVDADWRQALFDGIDLSAPNVEAVRDAVDHHDINQAEHAWAEYLRHRTSVPWTFDPHKLIRNPAFKDPVADAALEGTLQGGLVPILHTFPGNKVDWSFNATLNVPGVPFNAEWQVQLCRMQFWYDLAAAYRATGEERYAEAWVAELRSFVSQCTPPNVPFGSVPGTWRPIDAGIRMSGSWPTAFFSFLTAPAFADDDVAAFSYFCLMHGRYLRAFPTSGNWLAIEMAGLFTDGCVFPEMKEAAAWRSFAATKMRSEETAQFLPDGAQFELSPGYHNTALECLVGIVHTAKLVGRLDELPPGYIEALQKAYDYDLYLMTPDRSLPKFNDSGWACAVRYSLRNALEFFPDRADYKWIWTQGKEGTAPSVTSYQFPWAGYYAMRSGWETDANYLAFRAGPLGAGHWHQDKLNIAFWAYGREVLFDSGGGSYEHSKWRDYAISTFGHNTVLVDGLPQVRDTKDKSRLVSKAPIDAHWQSTAAYDFAQSVYDDGYGTIDSHIAKHTRRVLFIKPDLALIADTLVPADGAKHSYQARWNLNSTHTVQDVSTSEVMTKDASVPNLAVIPLQTTALTVRSVSGQTDPEVLGWYVFKDHVPAQVPATTVLQTIEGTGVQSFVTLLVPLKTGASISASEVTQVKPASWHVRLGDGRTLSITVDADPAGAMQMSETLADGSTGRRVTVNSAPSAS